MASKRSIAELAEHKAALLDKLSEVNAEIASRAGEVDESPDDSQPEAPTSTGPVATVETTTDKTAETAQTTTATP
jgi:hypothetical protein